MIKSKKAKESELYSEEQCIEAFKLYIYSVYPKINNKSLFILKEIDKFISNLASLNRK